jgi:hypothetical protein
MALEGFSDVEVDWYMREAQRLLNCSDTAEIASVLAVRDAACAAYVRSRFLTNEPEDSDVIAFLCVIQPVAH